MFYVLPTLIDGLYCLFIYSQGSKWNKLPRSIQMVLQKDESDKGFWERLLKDKQLEKTNVKVRSHKALRVSWPALGFEHTEQCRIEASL